MTRFEYANTVRDLLGDDLAFEAIFPRDEVALGFDNQAGMLSLTDLHVEAYLEAAQQVVDWVTAHPERIYALGDCSDSTAECARRLTAALSLRIQRRPPTPFDLDSLVTLFGDDFSAAGFSDGISKVLSALLQGPHFLYRLERSSADPSSANSLASPWVLASRLSFLFWSSGPDAELLDAAGAGRLASAADVEREARRLLDDPRARRGVLHFYLQWLNLSEFSSVEKDLLHFVRWDETLQTELGRETTRFIEGVLWEDDARLETLLRAPYTFANAVLEDFYGLPIRNPDSKELVRVDFPSDLPRRGLLTQAAILSTQAKANQTDPVHRGKFIREQFFCETLQPPPANLVITLPPLSATKTTRARFEQHRANPSCAGCHSALDPVGLAFEHYDAIGQYRTSEADQPIDATGMINGTDVPGAIDGVTDLALHLVQSAEVRHCVVRQWFRFTFGRGETEADQCSLEQLDRSFQSSDGNLRELLIALTQTDAFLRPAPAPEAESQP